MAKQASMAWVRRLTRWFESQQRVMPWRAAPSPYRIWISEVMLQQTQVATVIPYFERFIDRFPNVAGLATAELQDVLKLWEGLGYYSRARNLHKAAKAVVANHDGQLPETYGELLTLPGFGPYTAAAVASIAFGEPVPVVDGNVLRVVARFRAADDDIANGKTRKAFGQWLQPFIETSEPGTFNQAMMELGALICRPTSPDCTACPIARDCAAKRQNRVNALPVKAKKKPAPEYDIVVALIRKNGRLLVTRRREDQMLGGLWELPGGKVKPGETHEAALARELHEELGVTATVGERVAQVKHAYSHFKIRLSAYACDITSGTPKALEADELKWVTRPQRDALPFPTATLKVFKKLD